MRAIDFWKFVESKLSNGQSLVLMVVAEIDKSSPGKPGFKLALAEDGEIIGTIGGGPMEYLLVEEAKTFLKQKKEIRVVRSLLHKRGGIGEKSGLICGGRQSTILFSLSKKKISLVRKIIASIEKQKNCSLFLDKKNISIQRTNSSDGKIEFHSSEPIKFSYSEIIGNPNRLLIFGGGHIGLALSKIMADLDFFVVAFDSRENVSTVQKNIFADQIIISDYENISSKISFKENDFAVVVTTRCHSDYIALKSILQNKLKYIGLMGSKTKTKNIFHQLKKDGVSEERLKSIRTPIGLNIGADTPAEIAVSIASEIISVKNLN